VVLATLFASCNVLSATSEDLEPANNDVGDVHSLQRGARNFMNYCSGCHAAKYVRFSSIADGLELAEDHLIEYLMFNAEKMDGSRAAGFVAHGEGQNHRLHL
jgi:ubiquinol-cytochrome c reductase cytochrome c1 subunit